MKKKKEMNLLKKIINVFGLFILCTYLICTIKNYKNIHIKYNFLINSFIVACLIFLFYKTKYYKLIKNEIKKICLELNNIKWPGIKETFYMTILIIFISISISLFLWGLDNCILNIMSYITSINMKEKK